MYTCVCAGPLFRAGTTGNTGFAGGFHPSPSYLSRGPVPGGRREGGRLPGTQNGRSVGGQLSADISNAVVRLLSEYTGRGPTKARTYIIDDVITVVLQDTLTKGERSLLRDGEVQLVLANRKAFQNTMSAELTATVERFSGREVLAFLSANSADPDLAVETFILVPDAPPNRGLDSVDGHTASTSTSDIAGAANEVKREGQTRL